MITITSPIEEIAAAVRTGKVSAKSLVMASLSAIAAAEEYHAILWTNTEAVKQAEAIDRQIATGETVGGLAGVPFIAKDNFLTHNTPTSAASNMLHKTKPFMAPYQATAIDKLEAAGAIMVAKANMDAFAHGSSTENSDFGSTKHPIDTSRVPGGSSGGSAVAVALGLCSFALGTDTGGSIRLPASFCGVVGLKPTYGLVSRYGVVAMASSTDVIGPLTRTVEDAAVVLEVIAGQDPKDSTSIGRDALDYRIKKHSGDSNPLRIGVIKEYLGEGIESAVKQNIELAIEALRADGAIVEEVSLPSVDLALACYYIIVPAEISSNLSRYDGIKYGHSAKEAKSLAESYDLSRQQGFGDEAKRRILIGTYVLSSGYYDAYYKKAQKVRTLLIQEFNTAFMNYDLLIGPTAPMVAFESGKKAHDPLAMYLTDVCTVAVNLVGVPAISIPAGKDKQGLPIGLQLIGPQRTERQLLFAANMIENILKDKQ